MQLQKHYCAIKVVEASCSDIHPKPNKIVVDTKPPRIVRGGEKGKNWDNQMKWRGLKAFARFIVFWKSGADFVGDRDQKKPNITPTPVPD